MADFDTPIEQAMFRGPFGLTYENSWRAREEGLKRQVLLQTFQEMDVRLKKKKNNLSSVDDVQRSLDELINIFSKRIEGEKKC